MKVIETRYGGCRFRSRLEARWAVYFDAIGIKWEYEKEGFDFDGICYLPDFWLPQVSMWAEVKPSAFTTEERIKGILLGSMTGFPALELEGAPSPRSYWAFLGDLNDFMRQEGLGVDGDLWNDYVLDDAYLHESRFFSSTGAGRDGDLGEGWFQRDSKVTNAVTAAREVRFESGHIVSR
jgi:hypothetical protein